MGEQLRDTVRRGRLANSPAALRGYLDFSGAIAQGEGLTAQQREIVALGVRLGKRPPAKRLHHPLQLAHFRWVMGCKDGSVYLARTRETNYFVLGGDSPADGEDLVCRQWLGGVLRHYERTAS